MKTLSDSDCAFPRRLRFGVSLAPTDLAELRRRASLIEEMGVEVLGLADSPRLYHDPYVAALEVARVTSRISVGPMVTNVVTRDPYVTARAVASIAELVGERRVFAGFGAGYSGVAAASRRPSTLADLRSGVLWFREACELFGVRPTVFLAGAGPKVLAMGGEVADVIVGGGGIDELSISQLVKCAGKASPWVLARTSIHADRSEAARELLPVMASGAVQLFGSASARATLSPPDREKVDALRREYQYDYHGRAQGNPNSALVEKLGLSPVLAKRFAVTGHPEEVADRYLALARGGVTGVLVPAVGVDVDRLLLNLAATLSIVRSREAEARESEHSAGRKSGCRNEPE